MKKGSFLLVLLAFICMPTIALAEHEFSVDRFEFGLHAGVGFFVGPKSIAENVIRVQAYDALYFDKNEITNLKWPGIETFGFSVGYRIDSRWQVQLQTTRQRLCFAEKLLDKRPFYYNAMWHVEALAEFNLMNLGLEMRPNQGIYNVVPYVGLGYGITIYNKEATTRHDGHSSELTNTMYPRVGFKTVKDSYRNKLETVPTNISMYIPMAVGLRWRINENVQMKAAFQYQLHFQSAQPDEETKSPVFNSNLAGGTVSVDADKIYGKVVGDFHNCLFSVGVIANFGFWREDNINTNIDF